MPLHIYCDSPLTRTTRSSRRKAPEDHIPVLRRSFRTTGPGLDRRSCPWRTALGNKHRHPLCSGCRLASFMLPSKAGMELMLQAAQHHPRGQARACHRPGRSHNDRWQTWAQERARSLPVECRARVRTTPSAGAVPSTCHREDTARSRRSSHHTL